MSDNIRPRKSRKTTSRARADRERKCLVSGETYPVSRLIRFVLDPDGNVIPDVTARLPGRGGWILADGKTLQTAMKKKIFVRFGHRVLAAEKGEKPTVRVDDNLPDLVERLLRQRCLNYLGLVNRAGLLVSGFEKVRAALKAGKCRALITAQDAAAGGRSKICSGLGNVLEKLRMIDMFTREELGQTLGLSNGVHVALLSGKMTESFLKEFSRYEDIVKL
ncbi:COG2740: Predicted nucleic-acid-binding protein implicated in transcription termination / ribosomal protein L7Ae family protein [hydrothermal vent metagenome]|uniref:COG2740: Predicted nucleic-acid-binding protein implicated in transcription termination / ribosomal protein L7Ae family protein n=1 Tax=hydrothermal vent metagenome TaxID=652676 RepID=A0A3B0RRM1_9ZZZZ